MYLRFIPFIYQDLSYLFSYFYLPEMNYIMCISEHISHHCPKGHISFLLILSAHQHFSLCVYIYYHFQKVVVKVHFQNCKGRVPFTMQSRKTIFGRLFLCILFIQCILLCILFIQCLGFTDTKEVNALLKKKKCWKCLPIIRKV